MEKEEKKTVCFVEAPSKNLTTKHVHFGIGLTKRELDEVKRSQGSNRDKQNTK